LRDNGPETLDHHEAEITKAISMGQINRQVLEVDPSTWKALPSAKSCCTSRDSMIKKNEVG
jgi:hypothetical protein